MKDNMFLSTKWRCCFLYAFLCIFLFCLFANFPSYHARYKMLQEFSAEDGSERDTRTRWMKSSFGAGHGSSRSLIQKGTVVS